MVTRREQNFSKYGKNINGQFAFIGPWAVKPVFLLPTPRVTRMPKLIALDPEVRLVTPEPKVCLVALDRIRWVAEERSPLLWLTRFVIIRLHFVNFGHKYPQGALVEGGRAQEPRRVLCHPGAHLQKPLNNLPQLTANQSMCSKYHSPNAAFLYPISSLNIATRLSSLEPRSVFPARLVTVSNLPNATLNVDPHCFFASGCV